jgi:RNA polymerase sigma factor (sigma-70 family)
MATTQMSEVIQQLRRAALLREGLGLTDGQLLKDYLGRRDEAALAALVRRHGPMVWGVCRRVLCNYHDAEDAFQATFLVFVRKAASITSPERLASWLYGVAHQTALNARATTARRRARERQVTEMPEPAVKEQELWGDLQPVLDQELSRLPDKYRVAIVLCDLEGKTRKEAAQQLGVPEGTLAARLARGRVMLAKRLARHGLVVSEWTFAAVLAQNVASAVVPTSVVSSTIKAAALFAAGLAATGVISTKVAVLTQGVLKTMLLTRLKIVTAVLMALGALAGVGAISHLGGASSGYAAAQQRKDKEAKDVPRPQPQGERDGLNATWPADPPRILEHDPYLLVPRYDGKILSVGCVAKELKLTDKQIGELWKLDRELSDLLEDKGEAERRREYTKALHKKLPQVLTPFQVKRFQQVGLQLLGIQEYPSVGAMGYPEIQQTLKLGDQQKENIRSLNKDARKEWNEEVEAMGGIDVPRGCTLANKIHKATLEKALLLLDKDQKQAWDRMVGEPLTFTFDRFRLDDKGEYKKVGD